jgi:hypothetical protein
MTRSAKIAVSWSVAVIVRGCEVVPPSATIPSFSRSVITRLICFSNYERWCSVGATLDPLRLVVKTADCPNLSGGQNEGLGIRTTAGIG